MAQSEWPRGEGLQRPLSSVGLEEILRGACGENPFELSAGGRARVLFPGATPQALEISLEEEWLLLEARLPLEELRSTGGAPEAAPLLRRNGRLPGGIRFVHRERSAAPTLRGEILIAAPSSPASSDAGERGAESGRARRRIGEAIAAIRSVFPGELTPPPTAANGGPASDPSPAGGTLRALAQESGWEIQERQGGRLAITLETANFAQAIAEPLEAGETGNGGARIGLEIARLDRGAAAASIEALERFLLRTSGSLRLVRARIDPVPLTENRTGAPGASASLEVRWESRPSLGELQCALGALSLAADRCAREARALLEDENCARMFLALDPTARPSLAGRG